MFYINVFVQCLQFRDLLYLAEGPLRRHLTLTLSFSTLVGLVAKVVQSIIQFFSSSDSAGTSQGMIYLMPVPGIVPLKSLGPYRHY